MSLRVVPLTIGQAKIFVGREHSHLGAPVSGLCAVGVANDAGELVCAAILSRPVSRLLQDQGCAEVTRVASDRTPHAGSMCLGAIRRAGIALGWRRLVSYTLLGEAGTIYWADGWWPVAVRGPRSPDDWARGGRPRADAIQPGAKVRWEFGPDALPRDPEVGALVREMEGKVEIPRRTGVEALPLFAAGAR